MNRAGGSARIAPVLRALLAAGLAWAAFALAPPAQADTAEALIADVQKGLRGMARELSALGKSGANEDEVKKAADKLSDLVDPLIEQVFARGGDATAQREVAGYPESLKQLLAALDSMKKMKAKVGFIGARDEMRLCEIVYPREMPKEFRDALAKPGAKRSHLDAIAKRYATIAKGYIDEAHATIADLDELRDSIKSFSPKHRDFNALKKALAGAADDVYEAEKAILDLIEADCGPLVDWADFQAYEDAVKILQDTGAAIVEFETDAEIWMEANSAVGDKICSGLRILRDAICNVDWEEANMAGLSSFEDIADDTAKDFRNELLDLKKHYENNLRARGQSLAPLDSNTQRIFNEIKARHQKLGRYIYGPTLKGSNNPKVALWMRYGVEQHRRLQQQRGCHVFEKSIPGSGDDRNHPDCILLKRNKCEIIEFKPDTPTGRAAGVKISTYVSMLNDWVEGEWSKLKNEPVPRAAARTGMLLNDEFVLQARAHGCIDDNGRAGFSGRVEVYDPCSKDNDLQCEMPG